MKLSLLALACGFLARASGAPASVPHVVHEKRDLENTKWARSDIRLRADAVIPMSIGLTQRNLENGYEYLMDVSDPASPNFGKHWSNDKIAETFAASDEAISAVYAWLAQHGITNERAKLSKGKNWIKFDVTISEAEDLLRTEYKVLKNVETEEPHLVCDEYHVPLEIRDHIDFISPTVQMDAIVQVRPKKRQDEDGPSVGDIGDVREDVVQAFPSHGGVKGADVQPNAASPSTQSTFSLANCNQYITPDCLRALYGFPNGTLQKSSYGIVEYTPQAEKQSDLDIFYSNLAREIPAGTSPIIDLIDGAIIQNTTSSFADNGESDLDLEYAIALVYPQKVTLYQVGDTVEGATFNTFLDAIDGSYCTSGGGDVQGIDPAYPDPNPGGYKSKDCGKFPAAAVISTSYGYNEADLPMTYERRQCNEYMKLGLAGSTILFSSGDNGVAGNGNQCCTQPKCAGGTYSSTGKTFNPSFPSTCPYVTAVGATQIVPGASVTAPEEACETVIYSGGGFSNVFAQPSYQNSAIATYYKSHNPHYSPSTYNNSRTVRGYPDVSANGANYVVAIDGALSLIYGTSASSPVFGSIITLINEQRANAGKGSVGFINPTIYANPSAFNDITTGGNQGCGKKGFTSVTGWDPVTGLGTPNYQKLLAVFMKLP